MKTTIGGDRLGSGNKQEVSMRTYERSTHDLSYLWRSSMASGTLVPFMSLVGLPGDSFDIDLNCEVLTLPTVGPLFGSFKVQLDVFQVPIRLYNASLHMNKLGIGMNMSSVYLPILNVPSIANSTFDPTRDNLEDNAQVNPSALLKYLGISGVGYADTTETTMNRNFNGIPYLAYWDIYKNYYSNKQEERGFCIHIDNNTLSARQTLLSARVYRDTTFVGDAYDNPVDVGGGNFTFSVILQFGPDAQQMNASDIQFLLGGSPTSFPTVMETESWDDEKKQFIGGRTFTSPTIYNWEFPPQNPRGIERPKTYRPSLVEFPLVNIDTMRERILQAPMAVPFDIAATGLAPYQYVRSAITDIADNIEAYSIEFSQENLAIKTYQSDLFNNWISTEWIDGENGINAVTAVDTTGDSFTIDALNLAQKVYTMLNRIAISGGTYDDWLDAVYTHERTRSIENPMYLGSLIKELAFESVVSNADTQIEGNTQPLGTLAGRGRLTSKNKGGKIKVRIDEPSYLMGIISLTPRVDYSQGNTWDVNLMTMNDFHKPALDAIGFQELITEQMAWQSTEMQQIGAEVTMIQRSAGKQPAWINYMTAVNRTYGNFAIESKEMFMTLNRRYNISPVNGTITDLTTYIDPTKYNQIFADTNIDAQNFWVQISNDVIARRKMSAKVIPNL